MLTSLHCLKIEQGSNVVAHYNTNAESLKSTFSNADPDRFSTAKADLSSETDVQHMFDAFENSPIQVLVVNHGIWPSLDQPLAQMSLEQWNGTIATNLTSSFLIIREFLRRLEMPNVSDAVREKVAVVLIGSTAGKYGEAGHADYAASKSGKCVPYIRCEKLSSTISNDVRPAPLIKERNREDRPEG